MDLRQVPGVRFEPTDAELVEHYLQNWVNGVPLSCSDAVAVADVYSTEPWNLVPNGRDEAFFFSPRTLKNPKGKGGRAARTAGNGCWRLEKKKEQEVVSQRNGLVVGTKSFLTFSYQGINNYGWTMYEYMLKANQQFVLCRLKKSSHHDCNNNDDKNKNKKRKRHLISHSLVVDDVDRAQKKTFVVIPQPKDQQTPSFSSSSQSTSSAISSAHHFQVQDLLDNPSVASCSADAAATENNQIYVSCSPSQCSTVIDHPHCSYIDHDQETAPSRFQNPFSSSECCDNVTEPCSSNIDQHGLRAQLVLHSDYHDTAYSFENSFISQPASSIDTPLLCCASDNLQAHDRPDKTLHGPNTTTDDHPCSFSLPSQQPTSTEIISITSHENQQELEPEIDFTNMSFDPPSLFDRNELLDSCHLNDQFEFQLYSVIYHDHDTIGINFQLFS